MASILESLGSFDPDIRFMVLNDLANSLVHSSLQLDSQLIEPVVRRLGDTNTDVQNQAVKVIALFASSRAPGTSLLPELLLSVKMPETVRGVALKQIFQAGVTLEVNKFNEFLERNRVFKTVEGVSALTELAKRQQLSPASSADLTRHFLNLLAGQTHFLGTLSIVDGLALTIPHISRAVWTADVEPVILGKLSDPLYLGLLDKLAGKVDGDWLVPNLSDQLVAQVHVPFDEDTDFPKVEAALKSMSALMRAVPQFHDHINNVERVAGYAVTYRGAGLDSDGSLMWDSDYEDVDESVGVRLAAAQLIGAVPTYNPNRSEPGLLQALEKALGEETDRTVLTALYMALDSILPLSAESVDTAKHYTLKAIKGSNFALAELGARTTARLWAELGASDDQRAFDNNPVFDIFESVMLQEPSPPNIHEFITLLKPAMEHPETKSRDGILQWLFAGSRLLKMPAETQELAVSWLVAKPSTKDFDRVANIAENSRGKGRIAALRALPKVTSDVSSLVAIEARAIAEQFDQPLFDATAAACFEALVEYVKGANKDGAHVTISEGDASAIIGIVSQYLQRKGSTGNGVSDDTGSDTLYMCGELLISMPASAANSAIAALAYIRSEPVIFRLQKLLVVKDDEWLSAPKLLDWAIEHEALELIEQISRNREDVVTDILARIDNPEIHAAATCTNGRWQQLVTKYAFDKTPFAILSENGLRVLLALNYRDCEWHWYTLDSMASDVSNELQSKVLGTSVALRSHSSTEGSSARWFLGLAESLREPAFVAYATIVGPACWEIMAEHSELRYARAASTTISKDGESPTFSEFEEKFSADHAFLVASAKEYDGLDIQDSMRRIYATEPGSNELDGSMRADALAIAASRPGANVQQILEFATGDVLRADPHHIQTVSIGPFKHKVDSDVPLRLTVLEVLYRHLVTSGWGQQDAANTDERVAPEVVDRAVQGVVAYSLKDEHDVKVSGYKLLVQLASISPHVLGPHVPVIREAVNEDLSRKLKDNAVKQDVERNAEVVHVASALRDKLA